MKDTAFSIVLAILDVAWLLHECAPKYVDSHG